MFRDRELAGFGVQVYPSGGKVCDAHARQTDGPKRLTAGRHRVPAAEQGRQRAPRLIAKVSAGGAPVPEPLAATRAAGPTVSERPQPHARGRARGLDVPARARCGRPTRTARRNVKLQPRICTRFFLSTPSILKGRHAAWFRIACTARFPPRPARACGRWRRGRRAAVVRDPFRSVYRSKRIVDNGTVHSNPIRGLHWHERASGEQRHEPR